MTRAELIVNVAEKAQVDRKVVEKVVAQLNHRPRKCLSYRTPAEVYFSTLLHLT